LRKYIIKKRAVLSDADVNLLFFLWKWKVSTTSALAVRFYPHKNLRRAYNRLLVLEKAGIIQSRADIRGERYLWTLDKDGYRRIRHLLPLAMEKEGFESKALGHDLLCAAVLAGDWLNIKTPDGIIRITEQELSRLKQDDRPGDISTHHCADGYWYYKASEHLIALEVQISRQKISDYQRVGDYYHNDSKVHRVLWITERPSMHAAIQRGVLGRYGQFTNEKHQFVSFQNFFENGYDAPIEAGALEGTTIHQMLLAELLTKFALPESRSVQKLLDVRKSPHIAKYERFYRPGDYW
jgi:hypothetical protein